ncbi:MAG: hypothetical protein VYC17_03765 [Nitrospinota bacterium]|nr:hypothetical protein [Nitrospinota bacterium]
MYSSPIETEFRGVMFRSRVEARWAVFLHELKVDYSYEPPAEFLPSGKPYTPDFWINDWNAYIEIKADDKDDQGLLRCIELKNSFSENKFHGEKTKVLMFYGEPSNLEGFVFLSMFQASEFETLQVCRFKIEQCKNCGILWGNRGKFGKFRLSDLEMCDSESNSKCYESAEATAKLVTAAFKASTERFK